MKIAANDIVTLLQDADADLNEQLSVIGGCGNAHCVILAPEGQHTNAGCQCWQDRMKMQRFAFAMNRYREHIASVVMAEQRKS